MQLARRFPSRDITGNPILLAPAICNGLGDQHQFPVATLELSVIRRPAPTTEPRLLFNLDDFEQIMLSHAHDCDVAFVCRRDLFRSAHETLNSASEGRT